LAGDISRRKKVKEKQPSPFLFIGHKALPGGRHDEPRTAQRFIIYFVAFTADPRFSVTTIKGKNLPLTHQQKPLI
jgi:hypothetical protein